MILVHGSCVDLGGHAVLLRGPSGAGKSDLALRLIDEGGFLVSDDQTELRRTGDALLASPPATIAGMIEARGIGILRLDHVRDRKLALVANLSPNARIDRLPPPNVAEFLGIEVMSIDLDPFHSSCPAKLRLAIRLATGDIIPAS